MSTDAANHDTGRDSRNPTAATFGQAIPQVAPKGVLVPEFASCPGPAGLWPCALQFGHGGDHVQATRPGAVLSELERLRLENEDMRACLRVAAMLLRGVESYGNPGHSFRQDTADRCERLAR